MNKLFLSNYLYIFACVKYKQVPNNEVMKEVLLQTKVIVCSYDELSAEDKAIVDAARGATANSYAVYSGFSVGAALRLGNGTVVCGSNQENAAYPSGMCAERTTLFWANSNHPSEPVEVIAIAARNAQCELEMPITPCGACRQVMLETERRFGNAIRIILYGSKQCYVIDDGIMALLPLSFDSAFLE